VILVIGAQKIVNDVATGMRRIDERCYPFEDARAAGAAARLRHRALPAAQHGRALLQQAQQFRAVAARYDKRALTYQGTAEVASIRIWLRDPQDLRDTA
jgi:transposase